MIRDSNNNGNQSVINYFINISLQFEVDTNHFKGNYPDSCTIEGMTVWNSSLIFKVGLRIILSSPHRISSRHPKSLILKLNCLAVRWNICFMI